MNSVKKLIQLGQLGARQVSTSHVHLSSQEQLVNYAKLKAKQAKFQVDDGQLVHLKGGILDRLLYQVTLALCGSRSGS